MISTAKALFVAVIVGVVSVSSSAQGQASANAANAGPVVAPPAPAGPTAASAAVGFRPTTTTASIPNEGTIAPAIQGRPNVGRAAGLMIVGGAALLAGLIIGGGAGTAIAVGGTAVGLYGLYLWVQ